MTSRITPPIGASRAAWPWPWSVRRPAPGSPTTIAPRTSSCSTCGKATPLVDFFVIVTAASRRQSNAIASEIDQAMKKRGEAKLGLEGSEEGRWILIDYGDFVVHIFSPEDRAYYALEEIWGDAPQLDWQEPPAERPVRPRRTADLMTLRHPMNVLDRPDGTGSAPPCPRAPIAPRFEQAVRPATDPKFGDYQANGCMALAKATGQKPRDLAAGDRRAGRPGAHRRPARGRRARASSTSA